MVLYITFISIVNISISNEPTVGIFVSVCFTVSHRTGCVHYIFVCCDAAVLLTTRNFSSLFLLRSGIEWESLSCQKKFTTNRYRIS